MLIVDDVMSERIRAAWLKNNILQEASEAPADVTSKHWQEGASGNFGGASFHMLVPIDALGALLRFLSYEF